MTKVAVKDETKKNGEIAPRQEYPFFYSLQQEMQHLIDEFRQNVGFYQPKWFEPLKEFHTKVDIKDTEKELVITAELPGVDVKDIDVSLNTNGLTMKGEKRIEKEERDKGFYRMERNYGSFYRLIPIPCEIDKNNVTAIHKDGVLKITLPKTKETVENEHKISVKAG